MIGQKISHYRIIDRISAGGMGTVYKAEDLTLKRTVAIKVIKPSHQDPNIANKRFLREAQAISQIDHPNVITVFEVFQKGAANFLVMQYAPGETLRERLDKNSITAAEALRIAGEVAGGLQAAHDVGVVHRDIKPENIVVDETGGAKVLDFGVARLVDRSTLSRRGKLIGTLRYMAPEQIKGDIVDARTDIYALGVVLYEMLTGKMPFESGEEAALFYQITNVDPERVTSLVPGLPLEIDDILLKALAKKSADRYQTVTDLLHDLEFAKGRIPAEVGERTRTTARTHSNWVAAAYMGNVFAHLSEGLVGLERAMNLAGMPPPPGVSMREIGPLPCVPGFKCKTSARELRRLVDEIKLALPDMIAAVERLVDAAEKAALEDFDVVVTRPPGPPPDRSDPDDVT